MAYTARLVLALALFAVASSVAHLRTDQQEGKALTASKDGEKVSELHTVFQREQDDRLHALLWKARLVLVAVLEALGGVRGPPQRRKHSTLSNGKAKLVINPSVLELILTELRLIRP